MDVPLAAWPCLLRSVLQGHGWYLIRKLSQQIEDWINIGRKELKREGKVNNKEI